MNTEVSHDAGGYYCEHVYFLASKAVEKTGGKACFLHLRKDTLACAPSARPEALADRSRYLEIYVALEKVLTHFRDQKKTRFLLTGFGVFRDITNNPSGQFLKQSALVKELAQQVFSLDVKMHQYGFAGVDKVAFFGEILKVSDEALSENDPRSIQSLIALHRPEVVISMGVGGEEMRAETVASDRNLIKNAEGYEHCDSGKSETTRFCRDYTLASILNGMHQYF